MDVFLRSPLLRTLTYSFHQRFRTAGPKCLSAFQKGYFTVKPTRRIFSNIGIDQAHEQSKQLVNIHGGIIGILENSNALLKWAVSGPVVAEVL